MASQAFHEVEYDDTSVFSKDPPQEFSNDQELSFQKKDGYGYMEMTKNANEFKRKEENSEVWAEMDEAHFLKTFPAKKKELKRFIQLLREIANSIDKTNKDCTKVNIFASCTSGLSSILSIAGLTLAPFTAGGSLALSAAGLGFGVVAGVTSLSTTAYESVNNSKEMKRVEELMAERHKTLQNVMHPHGTDLSSESPVNNGTFQQLVSNVSSKIINIFTSAKGIGTNIQALKLANANPAMKALGKQAAAAGNRSGKTIKGVRKTFSGTSLAMSKGARMLGSLAAVVTILYDAHSIFQDSKRLEEGDPAEMAEEIREKADKLEKELHFLNMFYEKKRKTLSKRIQ